MGKVGSSTIRFPVLAMKLETTDAVKVRALTKFLKVPEISLIPANIGKNKYYSQKERIFTEKSASRKSTLIRFIHQKW